jgi:hypothetical protein
MLLSSDSFFYKSKYVVRQNIKLSVITNASTVVGAVSISFISNKENTTKESLQLRITNKHRAN